MTNSSTTMITPRTLSVHRLLQIASLADTAPVERVRNYICACHAAEIGNRTMAIRFTRMAEQWERIRIATTNILLRDRLGLVALSRVQS